MGPLAPRSRPDAQERLIGMEGGNFRTSSTAAWPPKLCESIADKIMNMIQDIDKCYENVDHRRLQRGLPETRPHKHRRPLAGESIPRDTRRAKNEPNPHLSGHTSSATCCRKVLSARLPVEATTLVDDGAELDDEAVLRVRRHGGLQKG